MSVINHMIMLFMVLPLQRKVLLSKPPVWMTRVNYSPLFYQARVCCTLYCTLKILMYDPH